MQRREDREEEEEAGEHEAGDEHAALQPDALPQLVDDGKPLPEAADGPWSDVGHQYLTRGSMSAAMMSTTKLVSATITASRATMPCTATKSRAAR